MYEGQTQPQGMVGNSLLTFLFGAAVGASVALLYAPTSGREARAQIAEKANQVKDTAGAWEEKAMSTAHDTLGRAAEKANQVKDTAGAWGEKAISTAHDTLDRAAETMKSASDSVAANQTKLRAKA